MIVWRGNTKAADKRTSSRYVSFGLFLLILFFTVDAFGWWNDQWQLRRKVGFDTSAGGADIKENLSEVPILIRLHTGNFTFTNAKENGDDIRFVGPDDQTLLKYHIEKYDTIDELAVLWVKLPKLTGGAAQDFIWMYYGNGTATAGQTVRETFDAGQAVVYHFGELEGKPQDATVNGNHAAEFLGGLGVPGVIGNGVALSGGADKLVIRNSSSLNFSNGFTFTAWIRISQDQQFSYLYAQASGNREMVVSIDGAYVYATLTTAAGATVSTDKKVALTHGQWHHVAVTAAPGGQLAVYIDGSPAGVAAISGKLPVIDADIAIGGAVTGGHGFSGEMDEIRIAGIARTADWIRAVFSAEGPEGRMCAIGEEAKGEGSGGPSVFYIASITVIKNITLDGIVIIGILMLLSLLGWWVFFSKTFHLHLAEKENRKFLNAYAGEKNIEELLKAGDQYANSSLYYIYCAGARKLSEYLSAFSTCRIESGESSAPGATLPGEGVSSGALNAIKVDMEKGLIEQSKRMNSGLVLLTLSISGGPFIGLLGTVWGVMTTFAVMAYAGEANIMSIVPGMASALSATIMGLVVAIPALFAYNFLTGRIKNVTADLMIFMDQFSARIEELHGERR